MRLTGTLMIILLAALLSAGCICSSSDAGAAAAAVKTGPVRIGFSMDTLKEERWQRDRDYFVARAKELGAEVLVQAANGDDAVQIQQAENLLTQGVDVLVVAPHNAEIAASIVESARRQGVPVLSYDRLIRNSDVNLYVSFDNVKVGETQARYLLDRAPKGNYVLIGGSPTDNNARLFRQGQMNVLQPAINEGRYKGRRRPVGARVACERSAQAYRKRFDADRQQHSSRRRFKRRHGGRRYPRARRAAACRQSRCLRPGRGACGHTKSRRRDAGDDGL